MYTSVYGSDNYEVCYTTASAKYGVPEVVLRSIVNIESSGNSYALNIKGKPVYAKDREQALAVLESNRDKSIDIGLMQINRWWFKKYGYPLELGLNPCWNIHMGAYILQYEYKKHGDIWLAVAYYYSPTREY